MTGKELLEDIKRVKTIADIGLLYSSNEFEKERHLELQEISLRLLHTISDKPVDELRLNLPPANDYPTAKVDVRAMILSSANEILLVKESSDGKWSLPGGWAEVGHSPMETAINECKEEAGLGVEVRRLLAVFDKRKHPHPPALTYSYKMVFYCDAITDTIQKGFDLADVKYFSVENLPELSEDRILKSQLMLAYNKIIENDKEAYFE